MQMTKKTKTFRAISSGGQQSESVPLTLKVSVEQTKQLLSLLSNSVVPPTELSTESPGRQGAGEKSQEGKR